MMYYTKLYDTTLHFTILYYITLYYTKLDINTACFPILLYSINVSWTQAELISGLRFILSELSLV